MTTAGSVSSTTSRPPSTSRVTRAVPAPISMALALVACGQPSRAASIWPVWQASSSMACLPRMTSAGASFCTTARSSLATASGCSAASVCTSTPRSAPMASAVRSVSCDCAVPQDTATTSAAAPCSFKRTAASTAISSNGFMDILTLPMSTPLWSALTRTLTL
ncbi:hypothetical protein D3C85_832830 [compost metagenome]